MILTGLLLGALLGFVLQRGRFCVTGAFRDVFLTRNTLWLTAFLVVIAIQAIGLAVLTATGVIAPKVTPLPLLGVVVGGLIFGYAIVMAGGCATGTYYRSGEGLVGSWLALIGYAGTAAAMKYGVLKPLNDGLRGLTVPATTIHGTLGIAAWPLLVTLVVGVALAVRHHLRKPRTVLATLPPRRTGLAHLLLERRWHPFATAVVIGVIAIAAWPLSTWAGRNGGLGITTPSANLVSYLGTAQPRYLDWGVMLVLGLLVGSFVAAKSSGEFRVRVPDATIAVRSTMGGVLMGVGASLAGGCTIGNAMVETAQFTWQGWISFAAFLVGTGAATRVYIAGHRRAGTGADSGIPAPVADAGGTPQRRAVLTKI
ncbi:MAG: YeeE/YedE family protein [Actinobacteria bacterium]|nr:YeeE/YedE family protein [Actinomycetota bacterium]